MPMYLNVHAIHTIPAGNPNRDESGRPKTAGQGGYKRGRLSSQSLKNVLRINFREKYPELKSIRTKDLLAVLSEKILEEKPSLSEKEADTLASLIIKAFGLKLKSSKDDDEEEADTKKGTGSKKDQLTTLHTFSDPELSALAKCIVNAKDPKKVKKEELLSAMENLISVETALFGRMAAACTEMNVVGAANVANAITTHKTTVEQDYFTALDDCRKNGEGSGHIEVSYFSDGTYLKSMTLDLNLLLQHLGSQYANPKEIAAKAAALASELFAYAVPQGKVHSWNTNTYPDMVFVELREDKAVSYAPAFTQPVSVQLQNGAMENIAHKSIQRLNRYYGQEASKYQKPYKEAWNISPEDAPFQHGKTMQSMDEMTKDIEKSILTALEA